MTGKISEGMVIFMHMRGENINVKARELQDLPVPPIIDAGEHTLFTISKWYVLDI